MKVNRIKGRTWLFLCTALLITVHILFTISAPFPWLEHVWGAGDLITFVGTIVLGYVAYWQTNNANETSDRLLKIEEVRYKLELRPFFMVSDYKAYVKKEWDIITNPDKIYISIAGKDKETEHVLCFEMEIINTTSSFITARFASATTENQVKWGNGMANQKGDVVLMQPSGTGKVVFYASPSFFEKNFRGSRIQMKFILENRLAKRYAEYFTLIPHALSCDTVGCSRDGEWFIGMVIQEYSISRFDKDENGNLIEIQEEL